VIIAGANLSFAASHRYAVEHERSERLRTTGMVRLPQAPSPEAEIPSAIDTLRAAVADLTAREQDYQTGRLARSARAQEAQKEKDDGLSPEQRRIIKLLETVFGAKGIEQISFSLDWSAVQEIKHVASEQMSAYAEGMTASMSYDYQESYREYEAMSLALAGTFTTEDGREFSFDLSYQLEREFVRTTSTSVTVGALQDPLILDLAGPGGFGDGRTAFDLIGDAGLEALPHLIGGSRYLAADLNGNGRIDDGGELFGPRSGDGFADLAAHDDDGNGFIDAGDRIWEHLRLWTGADAPALLSEWRVAAIGLLSVAAPFSYKDADNHLLGQNRRAGVFLSDDGKAGVVKQVDLVV
jgi:hypothetical protein